jgi:hypothetical protein
MALIEYRSQCPNCPAQATNRFNSVDLKAALERDDLKLYCYYCDRTWKASAKDNKELAKKLTAL